MASGVPVVSTRISGIPELITDGIDGLLVNPHDPGALADAIGRVLLDPSFGEWLGRAARKRVERDFDLQVNTRRLLSLFKGTPGEAFEEAA
jgi:glycosyltransferase involved in cell wall biosynthesis